MNVLGDVFSGYFIVRQEKAVPIENKILALKSLRQDLPDMFRDVIRGIGLDEKTYLVKGSCGQINLGVAAVPWIGIFKKSVTRKATDGYYIVLLFSEDMSRAYLTFNQGFKAFQDAYKNNIVAMKKLRDCAAAFQAMTDCPTGFSIEPIFLKTNGVLGKGYEAGSIFAKEYLSDGILLKNDLSDDLEKLLNLYEISSSKFGSTLINLDIDLSDDDFQRAVGSSNHSNSSKKEAIKPKDKPPQGMSKSGLKYKRDPEVARQALDEANGVCALSEEIHHKSFISKVRKINYLEAHHLIPFSQQSNFKYSLDVVENIIALCPNCHKRFHYAIPKEFTTGLKTLLSKRQLLLEMRGIGVKWDNLRKMYKSLDDDD